MPVNVYSETAPKSTKKCNNFNNIGITMLLQWTRIVSFIQHIAWCYRVSAAPTYIYRCSQNSFYSCCETGYETQENLVFPLIYPVKSLAFITMKVHQKIRNLYALTAFFSQQTNLAFKEKSDRKKPLLKFFYLRNKQECFLTRSASISRLQHKRKSPATALLKKSHP